MTRSHSFGKKMKTYRIEVEQKVIKCFFTFVEAKSEKEAIEKMFEGDYDDDKYDEEELSVEDTNILSVTEESF